MSKKVLVLITVIMAFGFGYLSRPVGIGEREMEQGIDNEDSQTIEAPSKNLIWQKTSAMVVRKVIRGNREGKYYEVLIEIPEFDDNVQMVVSAIEYQIISKEDLVDILYIRDEIGGRVEYLVWARDDEGRLNIHMDRPVAVIDSGHGGFELGEGGNDLWVEKVMNLKMAEVMKTYLEDVGIRVIMTRKKDDYVGLYDRVTIANYVDADILVSNHLNRKDGQASGIEVLYSSHSDRTFAKALASAISTETHGVYRVYKRRDHYGIGDFYALHKYTEVPSYIIEYGFADNEDDSLYVMANWEAMARDAAEAVALHLLGDGK